MSIIQLKYQWIQESDYTKTRLDSPLLQQNVKKVIGCLRYLLHTRPDIAFSVGVDSRFMERPTVMHSKAVKQILRCLKGTIEKKTRPRRERSSSRYYIKRDLPMVLPRKSPNLPSIIAVRHRPLCNDSTRVWRARYNPRAGGAQRENFFNQAQNSL